MCGEVSVKSRKKRRDDVELVISVPKKVIADYVNERCSPFQATPPAHRFVMHALGDAIREYYRNNLMPVVGGDEDVSG